MRSRALLLIHLSLLVVVMTWGLNVVSMKYLSRSLDSVELLLLRLILSSLFFGLLMVGTTGGLPRIRREDLPRVMVMALLGITVSTGGLCFAVRWIPAALGSVLATTNPVFTSLLSRVMRGEPLTRRKLVGIVIAFVGVFIVLLYGGPEADFSPKNTFGVLLFLASPLSFAVYTVMAKPMLERYDPVQFSGTVVLLGTIPLLPLLLFRRDLPGDVAAFGPSQWLAALVISLLALVVAYILWYRGLRVLQPTQVAVYMYLVPVFGVLASALVLGERITIYLLLGGLTIFAGVLITNTARQGPIEQESRRLAAGSDPASAETPTVPEIAD